MPHVNIRNNRILAMATILGAAASVLSLFVSVLVGTQTLPIWFIVVMGAVAVITVALMALTILAPDRSTRQYNLSDTSGINSYLFEWISNGGRVAIWTRNMSWADSTRMMPMLREKAKAGDLIICLPKRIDKSDELKTHGAEVVAYGQLDTPSLTFTIVNYGRSGSRVAVGRPSKNKHVIQEFSAEEHIAFDLAYDLVRLEPLTKWLANP